MYWIAESGLIQMLKFEGAAHIAQEVVLNDQNQVFV